MKAANMLLPSADDEMALFGDKNVEEVLTRIRGYGPKNGALKCGKNGSIPAQNKNVVASAPKKIDVVDSTAAGDSFNAGFLSAFLLGKSESECIEMGQNLAARVVQHPGAIIPRSQF